VQAQERPKLLGGQRVRIGGLREHRVLLDPGL
jgi:hypothetical protein